MSAEPEARRRDRKSEGSVARSDAPARVARLEMTRRTGAKLAHTIAGMVGFSGRLRFDPSRPEGTPRKLLDTTRLTALDWVPRIRLEEGIRSTYACFCRISRASGAERLLSRGRGFSVQ